jgi:transposase
MIRLSDVKVRLQYRWRVRQRLMVLHFARLHGPTAAARRFGASARTIRRWRVRWRQEALQGLVPRYPRRRGRRITPRVIELIGQARRDLAYGAQRTQLWLRRVHEVRVAVGTIQRIFRDIGLARLRRTPKRVPRQMKLFEKAEPGESVQVDGKFVKIAGHWAFQYTALDDCTRFRVLRLYRRLHQSSSLAFLGELCRAFPFRIRKLQCDSRSKDCSRDRRDLRLAAGSARGWGEGDTLTWTFSTATGVHRKHPDRSSPSTPPRMR